MCGSQCRRTLAMQNQPRDAYVQSASHRLQTLMGKIAPDDAIGYALLSASRDCMYPPDGRTARSDGILRITPYYWLSPVETPLVAYSGRYTICWYRPDGTYVESPYTFFVEQEFTRRMSPRTIKKAKRSAIDRVIVRPPELDSGGGNT